MSSEKVIDRIHKLLAMSETTNYNKDEAENAVTKATALMTRHNLTMQEVMKYGKKDEREFIRTYSCEGQRRSRESKFLYGIIQDFFFVKILIHREDDLHHNIFIGTRENVEIAMYVYEYLKAVFLNLWYNYKSASDLPANFKQSFYEGLSRGLYSKLKKERVSVEQEMGLVVVEDAGLKEATIAFFPRVTKSKALAKNVVCAQTLKSGFDQGQKIQINKSIKSNKKDLLLIN